MDLYKCENTARKLCCSNDVKWSLEEKNLRIGGKCIPLTPWRFNRRLAEMRALIERNGAVNHLCSYKSVRVDHAEVDLRQMLLGELDTSEWLTGSHVASVYALSNGGYALLVIAKMDSGITCALDLAATLSEETKPITRHEIVGVEGIITDRSINEQVPVEAIYMFNTGEKSPITFTDMDNTMPGLSPEEVEVVDNIIYLLSHQDKLDDWEKRHARLSCLVQYVQESITTGKRVMTEV